MKLLNKITGSLIFCAIGFNAYGQNVSEKSVTYKNQRGSTLTLIQKDNDNNTGTLTGTFTTAVGQCKEDVGVPLPITGFFNGNVIIVAVNFPHCKVAVAMTGYISHNHKKLNTLSFAAKDTPDPEHQNWDSNIICNDHYTKQ